MSYLTTPSALRQALRTDLGAALRIRSYDDYRTLTTRAYLIMRDLEELPNVIDDETFTACLARIDSLNNDIRTALESART